VWAKAHLPRPAGERVSDHCQLQERARDSVQRRGQGGRQRLEQMAYRFRVADPSLPSRFPERVRAWVTALEIPPASHQSVMAGALLHHHHMRSRRSEKKGPPEEWKHGADANWRIRVAASCQLFWPRPPPVWGIKKHGRVQTA
jgi:hypothetical protein